MTLLQQTALCLLIVFYIGYILTLWLLPEKNCGKAGVVGEDVWRLYLKKNKGKEAVFWPFHCISLSICFIIKSTQFD